MAAVFEPLDPAEEARIFHEGVGLFNEGEWFEAHEAWEDIWHMASGERKRFYQGLIQCAVTIEHMRRGNPRGVVTVWQSAREKFSGLDDVYMGVDIAELLEGIGEMVKPIAAMPKSCFEPRVGRGQSLPVDLGAAPRIALRYDPFDAGSS